MVAWVATDVVAVAGIGLAVVMEMAGACVEAPATGADSTGDEDVVPADVVG